jgi:hypothetical protein
MQKRGAHPALPVLSGRRGFTDAKLSEPKLSDAKARDEKTAAGAAGAVSEKPSHLGKSRKIMLRLRKPVRRTSPQAESLAAIMYRPDDGFVKTAPAIS